jgi:hypothetical protein
VHGQEIKISYDMRSGINVEDGRLGLQIIGIVDVNNGAFVR